MCDTCKPENPHDVLHDGLMALEGLRDLFVEASGKRQYEVLGTNGVAQLVTMVHQRVEKAYDGFRGYVPRNPPPQNA